MNRLIAELQRLYFLPGQQWPGEQAAGEAAAAFNLVGPDGRVRTLAVSFDKGADWPEAARLCRGIQEDLDLPAPVVSVSGRSGYRVWFSLAEPVSAAQARGFLAALRLKYLADIPLARLVFHPGADKPDSTEPGCLDLPPALHQSTGKWSAFIDPAMGSMFAEEPGLEMAPNVDKQADLLAGFESIKAGDFQRVLDLLQPPVDLEGSAPEPTSKLGKGTTGLPRSKLSVGSGFSDPKSFLLAVMNDPSASAGQRIKAAKALLPYFEKERP